MREIILTKDERKFQLVVAFLKKDVVFSVSLLLAIGSCFFSVPKLEYINFKVLTCLFNLMLTIKAFEELKLLDKIAVGILNKCHTSKKVSTILIFLCFVCSMLVTNDVALITFVPLTLIIGKKTKINMIDTIILQTVAANIGSSLTPMGNPQNLFIFSYYGLKPLQFFSSIIPLAFSGIIALFIFINRLKSKKLKAELNKINVNNPGAAIIWLIAFCIIVASVLDIISYAMGLVVTVAAVLILNRNLLLKMDYRLLITFVCFFIFIGNFSNSDFAQKLLQQFLKNPSSVFTSSIILSQLISNVPASILLSHFTTEWKPLLWGVNIGGLGTIIASLASVISYKLFIEENPEKSKTYLKKFSIYNFSLLILMGVFQYLII